MDNDKKGPVEKSLSISRLGVGIAIGVGMGIVLGIALIRQDDTYKGEE